MLMSRDYRAILKQELMERYHRNPAYSLRAFARHLDLESSWISDILNGKKGLSRGVAERLAKRLGFSKTETSVFCDLVECSHARSKAARSAAAIRVEDYFRAQTSNSLSIDAFQVIADWYHFALVQLLRLPSFREKPEWIAKALGISALQAADALERLFRLEVIHRVNGKLAAVSDYVISPDGVPSEAVKKFNEQLLTKATAAIQGQPVHERDYSSIMMAIDQTDLPRARERIRKFSLDLCQELTATKSITHIYCLSVQLINYTPSLKGNSA